MQIPMRFGLRQQDKPIFLHIRRHTGRYDQYVIRQDRLPILRGFYRQGAIPREYFRERTFAVRIKVHLHNVADAAARNGGMKEGAKRFNAPR